MPRNVYFSQGSNAEQHLFEDIQIEALKIYGQETYYLPRKIVTRDMILNEDRESQFDDAYMIEMYVEDIEGFGGEGNLMSKFGIEIRDEVTFVVARRTWNKLVGVWNNTVDNFRPNEGDLIYLPLSNSLFEISFVEHEQPFYQLQNLPTYKLQCRLFEYNDEDFRTGIEEIDYIETVHSDIISMLVRNITGDIVLGKRLYQLTPTPEYIAARQRKVDLPALILAKTEQISVTNTSISTIQATIAADQQSLTDREAEQTALNTQLVNLQNQRSSYLTQLQSLQPGSPQFISITNLIQQLDIQISSVTANLVSVTSTIGQLTNDLSASNISLANLQDELTLRQGELQDLTTEQTNIDTTIADILETLPYVSGIITEQDQIGGNNINRTVYITDIESSNTDVKSFYVSTDGVDYTYIVDDIESPTMTAQIYEIYDYDDDVNRTFENDAAAQNFEFESAAAGIIDFSEQNPFGEPD